MRYKNIQQTGHSFIQDTKFAEKFQTGSPLFSSQVKAPRSSPPPAAALPMAPDLPCDGEGACMVCRATPPEAEIVVCRTCTTPWHAQCLSAPPATLAIIAEWQCPDCEPEEDGATGAPSTSAVATAAGDKADLIAAIRAIEADASLTEREKAKRRQVLLSGGKVMVEEDGDEAGGSRNKKACGGNDFLDLFDEKFSCAFCMQLPDRPVTVSLSWCH